MAGAVALLVALFASPAIIRFALKFGVVDKPDERKNHKKPIPTLGGTVIFAAIISAVFVCFPFLPHQLRPDEIYGVMGITLGASIGFLPYNFNPARIFLGDSGSLLLGYMLAAISIMGPFKTTTALTVALPILILALPLFDTSWAIFRRTASGHKIYEADTGHVHHQLNKRGLSHRATVLILYAVSVVLAGIAVLIGIR